MDNSEVLLLLRKINNNYEPTEKELLELSKIQAINWDSDSIPQSIVNLTNLHSLNLWHSSITELPECFGNLTSLQELHLGKTQINKLPNDFGNLTNLQFLNLNETPIRNLPESFGSLGNLRSLSLMNASINELPESFGNLRNLRSLDLVNAQIRELPKSFGNLFNLQKLYLSQTNISKLPETFGNLTNLQSLYLNNSQISNLPEAFGDLTNLQQLYLNNSNIGNLPESFGNLKNLQSLHLNKTQINMLPESFGNLKNLQSLDLQETKINILPDNFGNLKNLQSLDLQETKINILPDNFGNLINLQELHLNNTQLSELPENFGMLTSLPTLDLKNTQINKLPKTFGDLINLQSLDLRETKINILPDTFGNLKNLQSLNLDNTQISMLPVTFGNLTNLQELHLDKTQISMLPDTFGNLKNLQSLHLDKAEIRILPDTFGNLTNLQELRLYKTQISMLPDTFGNLTNLQNLHLNNTKISNLPESFGKLTNLQSLHLEESEISILPDTFGNLTNLKELRLNNTKISNLPESFGKLTNLQSLHLEETQINTLPDTFGGLTNLQVLDLSNTLISELPDTFGNLTNLKELRLNNTKISVLPDYLRMLTNLRILDLGQTQIRELPDFLGKMKNLRILNLQNAKTSKLPYSLWYLNPSYIDEKMPVLTPSYFCAIYINGLQLERQPVSIFYQEKKLIKKYYNSEKIKLNESKVIFMGDGGAGKSYTIQRILNKGERLQNDTTVTHDITIEHWNNQDKIVDYGGNIDFWDFGGQDLYLSMHRCFLTERSCYVIVLCNRQYGSHRGLMRQARYWLNNISAYAKNSPILIAVNTWEGQPRDGIYLSQLQKEFPEMNIIDQIVYNAHDIDTKEFLRLLARICKMAQENYSYGLEFPESWSNIRNRLLHEYNNENTVSEREYYRICEEEMTSNDGYYNKQIAKWLLQWFNDLGYCFNYHDIDDETEDEEYQVLKPQWIIRAVYRIINYKINRNSEHIDFTTAELSEELLNSWQFDDGRIPKRRVFKILTDDGRYTEKGAEFIVRILIKFKLAYLLKTGNKEELFIPALCSDQRPLDFDKHEFKSNLALKTEYSIQFNYLPEIVIQHLMILCYKNKRVLTKVWKYGFHIEAKYGNIIVEMQNDTEIKIMYYEPEGSNDCYGLHEMREWLSNIYKGLGIQTPRDFVIIRNAQRKQTAFISVKALINAYIEDSSIKIFYTQDNDIYHGYSVDDLLIGLYGSNYKKIIEDEIRKHGNEVDTKRTLEPETVSENITYSHIAHDIEELFRTQFTEPPKNEKEVQEQLRKFLDAQKYTKGEDYEREHGKIMFSGREYIPDFVFMHLNMVIEVKLLKDIHKKSRTIEEMNADYSAYTKKYRYIIFLVYDLGFISNISEFKRDFEAKGNVKVIIIKH